MTAQIYGSSARRQVCAEGQTEILRWEEQKFFFGFFFFTPAHHCDFMDKLRICVKDSEQTEGRLLWVYLRAGYQKDLIICSDKAWAKGILLCRCHGVHKELMVAPVPSLWSFIQRILNGFSESQRVGNASCATFSICRVEGEAWVGEFYGLSQLFWFGAVNILPRGERLVHCVCRNSFADFFPWEALVLIIHWAHSTDRKWSEWELKFH